MGRPKLLDRDKVVDVAMCNYWRHGIDNVGMAKIARLSGFDRAGIYKEFDGESGLVNAVIDKYANEHVLPRVLILEACESPTMAVKLIIDAFIFDNVLKDLSTYGIEDVNLKWPEPPQKAKGCCFYGLVISDSILDMGSKTHKKIKEMDEKSRQLMFGVFEKAETTDLLRKGVTAITAHEFYEDQMLLLQLMRNRNYDEPRMIAARNFMLNSMFKEHVLSEKQ